MTEEIVNGTKQKSEMKILSRIGDTKYQWDSDNDVEVSAAREVFEKRVKKENWAAFRESRIGTKGDRIKEFDPEAQRIILVPPISGG